MPYFDELKKTFIKRIFTTVFVKVFQQKGYTIIHGACAIKNNKGVVLVGDTGSGKTTLLINMLNNGYGYVANDRLAIKKEKDDKIIVCGIPFSMGIISEDLPKSVYGYDYYSIEEINKTFLENKEIPKYFSTYMKSSVILDTIVFCKYSRSYNDIKINEVPNVNNKILSYLMYEKSIPEQKNYLHEIIGEYIYDYDFSNIKSFEVICGPKASIKKDDQTSKVMIKRRL